jgi:hypothetical protein
MQSLKALARPQHLIIGFWVKRCVQKLRNTSGTPVRWLSPRETLNDQKLPLLRLARAPISCINLAVIGKDKRSGLKMHFTLKDFAQKQVALTSQKR